MSKRARPPPRNTTVLPATVRITTVLSIPAIPSSQVSKSDLAHSDADYIEHALVAYQRGGSGANGRGNAIMGGMAKPLSKKEISDIAAYLASLPGSLVVRK